MAGKSLGTLTIDLVAKVGGFVAGMDKAERSSTKWRKQVEQDVKAAGSAIATLGAATATAAIGVGTAGIALLKSTSEQITETDRWAKSLRISTQELLAWQFAAEKAGVSGDNMADIFKDIGDKIGDAVLNKSGEAVDALNALGLSADKLSKSAPDEQLLAIGEALSKIGTNAEKTTILESLGNDLSKLLPLFDNNNAKLKAFIQQAKDYGVAPTPESINDLIKVNEVFQDIESQVKGLKIEIASGLAKVDLSGLSNSLDKIKSTFTDPKVLQGLVSLVSEIAELSGLMAKAAAETGRLAAYSSNRIAALGGNVDLSNIDQINERISYLQNNLSNRKGIYSQGESFVSWLTGGDDSVATLNDEIKNLVAQREKLIQQNNKVIAPPTGKATVADSKSFALGANETNGKTTPDAGAKKLENAFKATEQSYLRQKELIDTTGKKGVEVTELQKLQIDILHGRLEGLNQAQKTRLEQLASEVDQLNATKKANEDNLKVAEFVANLQRENANSAASLNADIAGAGLSDKARDRMREMLGIQADYLDQRRELERQYQSGDIESKDLYDRKTAALNDALQQRLAMQQDYYQKLDTLQGDWLDGATNGLANWIDSASDYYSQASNLVGSTLGGFVDNLSEALAGNKVDWEDWSMSVLQSLQKILLNAMLVNSIKSLSGTDFMSMFSFGAGTAGGSTPSGAYSSAASGVRLNAKGGVYESADLSRFSNGIVNSPTLFAFAKGAGLMGEAGPEAIMPLTRASDGSLGVRMVNESLNAVSGRAGGSLPPIHQEIHVSGNGDAALIQAMKQAAREGAAEGRKQARQDMLQDFQSRGQGRRLLGV
ncbi:phage tail tape measure protein, lambda family [Enterobacter sp. kpr-6]|uniref:phage tail tape measure protein n=1 Tax=Enterobacter sp. kpr-6 TaxID=1761782 RepID=UPI0008EFE6B3|nr:phage tail tape measure protein [Enterobacter sp. kpr-6]SFR00644.1 phage tail tape measure protein, lambda family [Enterobacter sp. kpr-6]